MPDTQTIAGPSLSPIAMWHADAHHVDVLTQDISVPITTIRIGMHPAVFNIHTDGDTLIDQLHTAKAIGEAIVGQALDALEQLADNADDHVDLTAEFDAAQALHWTGA